MCVLASKVLKLQGPCLTVETAAQSDILVCAARTHSEMAVLLYPILERRSVVLLLLLLLFLSHAQNTPPRLGF